MNSSYELVVAHTRIIQQGERIATLERRNAFLERQIETLKAQLLSAER